MKINCHIVCVKDFQPDDVEFKQLVNALNVSEMERINKFRFKIDAYRSLIGRYLIRCMVAEKNIVFNDYNTYLKRSKNNKPYVDMKLLLDNNDGSNEKTAEKFNFNVSHHGMWVGGVSSLKYLVGIDIMSYDYPKGCESVEEFFKLMRRSFSDTEWSIIYSSSTNDELIQLKTFYHFWSLKESYIKAIGVGLGIDLKTIEFRFLNDDNVINNENPLSCKKAYLIKDGVELNQWCFHLHHPDKEHVVSIGIGPLIESVDLDFLNVKDDDHRKQQLQNNSEDIKNAEIEFHKRNFYDLF
jgi:4'-phosphopantetheinyl transferase